MYVAAQLKSSWVHAAKIKSKWKAEKRRDGLPTTTGRQQQAPISNDDSPKAEPEDNESPNEDASDSDEREKVEASSSRPDPPPPESLRELSKKAYAPASLHNHRSDPLHRRKGESSSNRGGPSRGSGPGRGRGRGQPNMKLRMNAMLEKIKQDLA